MAKEQILVVDDEEDLLELIVYNLGKEGYRIERAAHGEEGLQHLQREPFDCVLVDLVMPGLDGIQVCRRINELRASLDSPIAVLMLTARENKEDLTRALEAGADDFVGKSSDMAVLKGRIRALLRRKFFQEENRRILEELKNKELEAMQARADQAVADTELGVVHGLALQALGGVELEDAVGAQDIGRAHLGDHVRRDLRHDLVKPFLRADRLRHDLAQAAEQDARSGGWPPHCPLSQK